MQLKSKTVMIIAGALAGTVNGLLGGGGGMILVPLLAYSTDLSDSDIFPASIAIILPICLVSLFSLSHSESLPWKDALPYLFGSGIGGILSGIAGKKIPVKWLHRILGILILWGGFRYLC